MPRRAPNSGSITVRGNGRIAVRLPKDLDASQRLLYGPTKGQRWLSAEQATAWLDAEVYRRRHPRSRAATTAEPLGAYLLRWWQLYSPGWPARTAAVYRRRIRLFASIADVPLGELTHEVVMGAISTLQTARWRRHRQVNGRTVSYGPGYPYSAATIRSARSVLHQALAHVVPHILPANPVQRIRLPRVQEAPQRVWDADQADRFLEVADRLYPHLAFPMRLLLRRALRRGELLAIRRADIDWRRRVVTIRVTAHERAGQVGDTKGRQIRDIPLGELYASAREHVASAARPSVWLVPGRTPAKPLSLRQLAVIIDAIITEAGLPRITAKDMRATAATVLLDRGVALPRVSFLLGHSDVAITARFYARAISLTEARIADLAADLDRAFERPSAEREDEGREQAAE